MWEKVKMIRILCAEHRFLLVVNIVVVIFWFMATQSDLLW
jgi:hypothetical protein